LNEKYPDRKDRWKVTELPDAETWEEGSFRVKNFLRKLAEVHPQKKIAIVTHGMLMRTLVADIQNSSQFHKLPNCAIVEIIHSLIEGESSFQINQVVDLVGSYVFPG
ncbi:MAG: histidine phosphatase family protein, partial [Verrucomicrobia bacterium]|nr:histidine phosphatase family protein [Verrucomicrobiota bacterium]